MARSDVDDVILTCLRAGTRRAEDMAQAAGCTVRTIYRRIDRLRGIGYRISGSAGYGYMMRKPERAPSEKGFLQIVEAIHNLNERLREFGVRSGLHAIEIDKAGRDALYAMAPLNRVFVADPASEGKDEIMGVEIRVTENG